MAGYALPYGEIAVGDAVDGLRSMPAGSARCCVTSPPYFGLRSYLPNGVRLRDDLTLEERAYVESELAKYGVLPTSDGI